MRRAGAILVGLAAVVAASFWLLPRRPVPPTRQPSPLTAQPSQTLPQRLAAAGLKVGQPVFIRIIKESSELEVWMAPLTHAPYKLLHTYPICRWSGRLGPKLREGDGQSPEGFYAVTRTALNPNSAYHLSFNLGYPNAYDRAHGRTGSLLMVHGDCKSVGCYAMTDAGIEEIYTLVDAALVAGQPNIPVHIFPFRMTDAQMRLTSLGQKFDRTLAQLGQFGSEPSLGYDARAAFWANLKDGWELFETARIPPTVMACGQKTEVVYRFGDHTHKSCVQITGGSNAQ
jgi:murein L,D-transpeptidase YafK